MKTLSLIEAAAFLHLHPAILAFRAQLGIVPGSKPGREWIFLEGDLVEYLRSLQSSEVGAPARTDAELK